MTNPMRDSLIDPKYMGGLDGSKGYRFEIAYLVSRLHSWLSTSDLESFQQEGWSDVELFFSSGSRQLIQIKDHALRKIEFAQILDEFRRRENAFKYQKYIIVSAGLASSIEKLNRQLKRYRDIERHNDAERADVAKRIRDTLLKLNLERYEDLILEKIYFDSNLATIKDTEFYRNAFLGGLISAYRISIESAENIFLRTTELLNQRHGKLIELSLFREELLQTQLEDQEVLLSNFKLISKRFLQSLQTDSPTTFFYTGAAPTWSDIVNKLDLRRDIAAVITPLIRNQKDGKLFVPIVAEAGEGKSTLLKRLAADLANENAPVLYHDANAPNPNFKEAQRIAQIAQRCVYIFFDEAAKVQNLNGFLQSVSELPISVVIIAAARPYEMTAIRSAYSLSLQVALDSNGREYSMEGLSDGEIERLVQNLLTANILSLPVGVAESVAVDAIKKRTDRKFLVLTIELTQGARVQDIVRDEIERIRKKGEPLFSMYRYICLLASIDSFITVPMVEKLVSNKNVRLDVASELPGLVVIEGERLYPRHNRIGEIATEIFFQQQEDERGDTLCRILSLAFTQGEFDVVKSAIRISHSVPESQVLKVVNHLIDEASFFGEIELTQDVIEEFEWVGENTELFLDFLTARTPFLWDHIIFPNGPNLHWREIEKDYDLSFDLSHPPRSETRAYPIKESFDGTMKWAQIFGFAAWYIREQTPFLIAITDRIYDILESRYPDKEHEICFAHAEFLSHIAVGKDRAAIPLYERILEKHPSDADAHAGLAAALYMTEAYSGSLDHFKIALKIDPQSLFRVANEGIFEEMTQRMLELEEYLEYKKAVVKKEFKTGRGYQHIIAMDPTLLVDLKKREPDGANSGLGLVNQMDYGDAAEERRIAELDRLLEHLRTKSAAERRQLEVIISDSFGELREEIAITRNEDNKARDQ
jgi:tetratricopeptide (TPR) repeat protein